MASRVKTPAGQTLLGWVTTHCAGCVGYRDHSLWKEGGRGGRHMLSCDDCGHERELRNERKGSNGSGYKR